MLKLSFVLSSIEACNVSKYKDIDFSGISTDSNKILGDELFFALKGERLDGHNFISDALDRGAQGAVVEKDGYDSKNGKIIIRVPSTFKALGDLAQAWRGKFQSLKLAAITGSNGKTTTKEMVSSILSLRHSVLKNSGNFNNLIGLPLTLLKLTGDHNAAVVELGMNDFGEIKRLTEISNPDIGAITNVGKAHLEKLGSIEGVAKAKGELIEGFDETNAFVVNMDDPLIRRIAGSVKCIKIPYGIESHGVVVSARDIMIDGFSAISFKMNIEGREFPARMRGIGIHNVMNALCASGIALLFGCSDEEIQAGLERYSPVYMRMEVLDSPFGFKIINDTYNSNPDSMRGAVEELIRLKSKGRTIAVLGDMLELGNESMTEHRMLGEFLRELGVDYVIAYGKFGRCVLEGFGEKSRGFYAETHEDAAEKLKNYAGTEDLVLVKGSRGMKMENVIQRLFKE
ncbi:MAG: UDP-N-acetylmuramoyl-tripeptide--D-alanyl-D-alanine ligase [Deltaproteobacteria bacterium]|nr:UDP-N-acetylmuramoyl-tripeptide--D-alanyl-D-alanine ligase [Deltaproteobacteria bacterium]